ncbi:MAG: Flp pilus assembly complex ATPase component TadA [Candidatus Thermoplasmatota archaeon]|nr:Flp pilus assembly complex ATPase component TadA [Candidatus Thermoplasmatota archaeon]
MIAGTGAHSPRCTNCGRASPDGSAFCSSCGKALPKSTPAAAPPPRPASATPPVARSAAPLPPAILALRNLEAVSSVRMNEGIRHIFQRDVRTRPGFSGCWIASAHPENGVLLHQYALGRSRVSIYQLPNEIDTLYHLDLSDYKLTPQHIHLLDSVRKELLQWYPKHVKLVRMEQTRQYVEDVVEKLLYKRAKELGISLGSTSSATLARLKELSEILSRHVTGLGVVQLLLQDPHIQDVYIDAPASENRIHLRITGYPDARIGDKALTNIILTDEEAESILARLRIESGRAYSEAMPILETDLKEYNTRASVLGPPPSPDGIAITLRRHATDPWTLLKLISMKSLTPEAAGLLSFLVDGRSAMLVSGARGAGKTSLVGALMLEFPKSQRILTVEDTLELPTIEMRRLGYKVQTIFVRSAVAGQQSELSVDDALKVSLRLGESAIILGEVRGHEAKTLYEAMRAGTAGSAVLGTIHGNSAHSVYERVVHDLGIAPTSFNATDIVVISGLVNLGGSVRTQSRRVTQIAELDKNAPDLGVFEDLMSYQEETDSMEMGKRMAKASQRIRTIADSWGMSYEEALQNISVRGKYREDIVNFSAEHNRPDLLGANWVSSSNTVFWEIMERHKDEQRAHTLSYDQVLSEWRSWFAKAVHGGR